MPIIAMTKEMWSMGSSIGQEIARELGYQFIRKDIMREAAREFHALEKKLVEAVEEKPGFFEILGETARRHHIFVAAEVFEFALRDRVVIMGRWSTQLLKNIEHAVRVRICAPLDIRMHRMKEQLSIGDAEAFQRIRQHDQGVASRIHQFFDVEWADPLHYDLTINTGKLSLGAAVAQVTRLAEAPEFQPTETSRRRLENLALAAKVRAMLKSQRATVHLDLDVVAHEGDVTIRGIVPEVVDRDEIDRIARTVAGVRGLKNELIAVEEHRRL